MLLGISKTGNHQETWQTNSAHWVEDSWEGGCKVIQVPQPSCSTLLDQSSEVAQFVILQIHLLLDEIHGLLQNDIIASRQSAVAHHSMMLLALAGLPVWWYIHNNGGHDNRYRCSFVILLKWLSGKIEQMRIQSPLSNSILCLLQCLWLLHKLCTYGVGVTTSCTTAAMCTADGQEGFGAVWSDSCSTSSMASSAASSTEVDLLAWAQSRENAYAKDRFVHGFVNDKLQLELVLELHGRASLTEYIRR